MENGCALAVIVGIMLWAVIIFGAILTWRYLG